MTILRGQKYHNDCGPTCFANTLNILGYNIGIKQANKLCGLEKDGTDSDDLIKAFDKYGFEVYEKVHYSSKSAWRWLIKNTNLGIPTIISTDDDGHWVLVLLAGKDKAQIFDPDKEEPELITSKDLLKKWIFVSNNKTILHSLALVPYKNKSVRAVIMREKLIKTWV